LVSRESVRPFTVFISSAQIEFEALRRTLKTRIDNERFVDERIMRGILIEDERGPVIAEDIKREIDGCSIYLGIFGAQKSDWTIAEYREARTRDLPMLVYQFKRRRGPGRPGRVERRGRKSDVQIFLDTEVKSQGIRIRGPYRSEEALEEDAMLDLASEISELVKEAGLVRKTIHRGLSTVR
jgi:hypothetical protein